MKTRLISGLTLAIAIAACSESVTITAETTGSTSTGSTGSTSSSSGTTNSQGSGGATTSSSSSTSSSSGAGGVAGKVATADTDMAQYQAINADLLVDQPVLQGPFFVTDLFADNQVTLSTVTGTDCSAPQTKILFAPNGINQVHGIRMPVLAGQSLCHSMGFGGTLTILGFRPY